MDKSFNEIMEAIIYNENKFYDLIIKYKINDIPIWRIIRYGLYRKLLDRNGHPPDFKRKLPYGQIYKNFYISFIQFVHLLFKKEGVKNAVFAFPRPIKFNGLYIDKISDPVIDCSDIDKDYIIFQRRLFYNFTPRLHEDHTCFLDFIDYTSYIFSIILLPITIIRYFKDINNIYYILNDAFNLKKRDKYSLHLSVMSFRVSFFLYKILFKHLKFKNVFIVSRNSFYPAIAAAKAIGIQSLELQHGAFENTLSLYSSLKYDTSIDPDWFLVFGSKWVETQFAIPIDKIINIGFAYKSYIANKYSEVRCSKTSILVISIPEISDCLVETICKISTFFPDFQFDFRPHPQEKLSNYAIELIAKNKNVIIADNTIESMIAIMSYKYVVGISSTVLYEAVSLKRKVGVLNFENIKQQQIEEHSKNNFYIIDNVNDFKQFLLNENTQINVEEFYGDFNSEIINKLINR